MIKEQLYNKTVDILKDAYFNDTLQHGNCHACAVGNMVAANIGISINRKTKHERMLWGNGYPYWDVVFCTYYSRTQKISPEGYKEKAREQIDSTGYSWQELAKIEYAFETAPKGNSDDEWMFNGLMAVIDVLGIIHENTDTVISETAKKKFSKTC